MLQITIPAVELWDERTQQFINRKEQTLRLEHSLVSLSKWESKWHKSFLDTKELTREESLDYIRCMTITQNVSPETYDCLTADNMKQINDYMGASMTATFFSDDKKTGPRKKGGGVITAELIYYWMIAMQIPTEYEKWHLNRLITLIRVCEAKNSPQKKRSSSEILKNNAALNAARRKQLNTTG
jgi:hypothetical protein